MKDDPPGTDDLATSRTAPADRDPAAKFDALAETYSSRYADPSAVSSFYVGLVAGWGTPVAEGASVLEVSCADGFMTEALVSAGYRVVGIDVSHRMVEVAQERLRRSGLSADLRVADVASFIPDQPVDVLLAPMWTFFAYVPDAADVLARLARSVRIKAIVDCDPRKHAVADAEAAVRSAGFDRTDTRVVSVPMTRRLGHVGKRALSAAVRFEPSRKLLLRRHFNVAILGERAGLSA